MVAPAKKKEQEVERRSDEWRDMGRGFGGRGREAGVFGEMPKTTAMNAKQRSTPLEGRDPIARHQSACERSIPADGRCVTSAAAAARHCGASRSRLEHASKPSAIGSKRTGGGPNASHRGSLFGGSRKISTAHTHHFHQHHRRHRQHTHAAALASEGAETMR